MDSSEITRVFSEVADELNGRAGIRTTWMGYLYHVTQLENAIGILSDGAVLSRSECIRRDKTPEENASRKVIEGSDAKLGDYVRLYFRPKTPTFYHNEGFRSKSELSNADLVAHCPIPIVLIFDGPGVLSMPNARFSSSTLAARDSRTIEERTSQLISDFRDLPFESIFHDSAVTSNTKDVIHKARQAEVIVPQQLPLDGKLVAIRTRSDAERATFLHLLRSQGIGVKPNFVRTDTSGTLFHGNRMFVRAVSFAEGRLRFDFNLPTDKFGASSMDFDYKLIIRYPDGHAKPYQFEGNELRQKFKSRSSSLETKDGVVDKSATRALVSFYLDQYLAFESIVSVSDSSLVGG